ncbi:MAG: GxxExxY protein [Marinilabiliales bacterium]|nr:MAG: GxxExxY protein [Marinilabiliales bacterium]
MNENELSEIAVDIAFRIHTSLGPGLLESVYEKAFAYELSKQGVEFETQVPIKAFYDGADLGVGFRADIIIEKKLIIEIKSVEAIDKVHHKQLLTYLTLSGLKLGLLINFNERLIKNGISRKIMGTLDD